MLSPTFFAVTLIIAILSIALLAVGFTNEIDPLVAAGFLGMAITYAIVIAICLSSMWNDIQVWRTNELNDVLTKNTTQRCYTIDGNHLCGNFVYENTQFRYQVSGDTLNIQAK